MSNYTYYKPETGEIVGTISGAQDPSLAAIYSVLDGVFQGDQYYVSNGQAVPKAPFSVTVSGKVISGIPVGTTALVEGAPTVVDNGVLAVTDVPNPKAHVVLSNVQYLTEELVV